MVVVAVAVADHEAVVQVGLESADASWAAVDAHAEAGVVDEPTPPNDSGSRPLGTAVPADYHQCSCQRE